MRGEFSSKYWSTGVWRKILVVVFFTLLSYVSTSSKDRTVHNIVASDGTGLTSDPGAKFVLVRSPNELDRALSRQKVVDGKLVLIADLETGPGLIFHYGDRFPAPGALAAANDPALLAKIGEYYGKALACSNFDMVMAPTADIFNGNTAVGWRSLGSDIKTVLPMLGSYIKSLAKGGIIPFIKHYPGHGSANGDTHESLATIEKPWQHFMDEDLKVFKELSRLPELGGIMLGHLRGSSRPQFNWPDLSNQLAMISPFWMNLIRKEWKYNGVLVSDSLVMDAASEVAGGEAYCTSKFFQLGGDLVLGADMRSQAAFHASQLYAYYHPDSPSRLASAQRLQNLMARVYQQRKKNKCINCKSVALSGKHLAKELASKALISTGKWHRPIDLRRMDCFVSFRRGQPGKYSNPSESIRALGCRFAGEYDFTTSHPQSLLLVYGFLSEPALNKKQISYLSTQVQAGLLKGVIVCGWPGLIYDLEKANIPAVATWGSTEASMFALSEWCKSNSPSLGKWPYKPNLATGNPI